LNPFSVIVTFLAGAIVGEALADGGEAFIVLFGAGVTGGALIGAFSPAPRGSVAGLFGDILGLCAERGWRRSG